jgi:hypothetical protein
VKLPRKLSDFVRLQEAEGNLPRLAGIGLAVASSIAASVAMPAIAQACNHGDYPYVNHGDQWCHYNNGGTACTDYQYDNIPHDNGCMFV